MKYLLKLKKKGKKKKEREPKEPINENNKYCSKRTRCNYNNFVKQFESFELNMKKKRKMRTKNKQIKFFIARTCVFPSRN